MGIIDYLIVALAVFGTTCALIVALQKRTFDKRMEAVAGRSLGPVLLALSAGATANTGFVITGAVGLGYLGGLSWCLLPLGWFVGDVFFWVFLAKKIVAASRNRDVVTLPELLQSGTTHPNGRLVSISVATILIVIVPVYMGSQWLAAGKMANAIFAVPSTTVAILFGSVIVFYTSISGFRGAVYTDFVQSLFMLFLVIGISVIVVLNRHVSADNLQDLPAGFLTLTGGRTFAQALIFAFGFSIAAIGFGLGEPQMVVRWMAAKSEKTIVQARWLYIFFVQATWLSYTALGAFIRLKMNVRDPEQGLIEFIQAHSFAGVRGLLVAGAICTIAPAASSTAAVCIDMLRNDIMGRDSKHDTAVVAIGSIVITAIACSSILFSSTVFSLAITAVSLEGAALSVPVLFTICGASSSVSSFIMAIFCSLIVAILWRVSGLSQFMNEVGAGILSGLVIMYIWPSIEKWYGPSSSG